MATVSIIHINIHVHVGEGVCAKRTKNIPAVFETLTAWHCEKGAEFVNAGDVQFEGFFVVNNQHAGLKNNVFPIKNT